ncbi:MAG: ABC transporter permease [Beutenbergiaceae bacterium]
MYTDRSSQLSIGVFLALLLVVLAMAAPRFFDGANLADLGINIAIAAIVGIGALSVIATGNIDVSAGSVYAISGIAGAAAANAGVPGPLAFLIAIATGAGLGLINAVLVTVLHLPSIIATLGTSSVFSGALIFLTGGGLWVTGLQSDYTFIGQDELLGLGYPIWVTVVVLAIAWYVLNRTVPGRRIFAVGSNAEAARLSGINTRVVEGSTFVVNGVALAIAATLTIARLGQAQTNLGASITMAAITIAVVGGTSAFGGTGNLPGIVLAAALVTTTGSALTFLHLDPLWSQAIQGLFILAALAFSVIQRRRERKPLRLPFTKAVANHA